MLRCVILSVVFLLLSLVTLAQVDVEEGGHKDPVVVVSPVKLNIIYRGVDNPIDVAVPRVPCDRIDVSVSHGRIEGAGCSYAVNVGFDKARVLRVVVTWSLGAERMTAEQRFRVMDPPPPVACFAGSCTDQDTIHLAKFKAVQGVIARFLDLDFDLTFRVVHYRLRVFSDCAIVFDAISNEARLTANMSAAMQGLKSGDEVLLTEVKAEYPSGAQQEISPLRLIVR